MRILYVTTISLTMNTFFKPHIDMLVKEGHEVDIACNCNDLNIDEFYINLGCKVHQVDFSRSPLSVGNIKAFKQLKNVIKSGSYDIVHCHTPNASVITRLVCRKFRKKNGLKVFYTAHGFHFYKGAPKLNWMIFYPIEKFCSRYTDKLITINNEDFQLAKSKFRAKAVHYVPGVGIDLSKFENIQVDKSVKRMEIGVRDEAILLLSVGELNENKNHQIIIKAISQLNDSSIHYVIAGEGAKKEYLLELSRKLNVEKQVHLLGYRKDVVELNYSSDIFCFPSLREGLGIAAIEALACGLPLVTSNVHGINDYSKNGETGYKCNSNDVDEFADAIKKLAESKSIRERCTVHNKIIAQKYSLDQILLLLKTLYFDMT